MARDDEMHGDAAGGRAESARAAAAAGLCATCAHARTVESRRGSRFWLCGLADRDPAFARYPRLPVAACPGHRAGAGAAG